MSGLNRNDPCHCGSGRKYKKCCFTKDQKEMANKPKNSFRDEVASQQISGTADISRNQALLLS